MLRRVLCLLAWIPCIAAAACSADSHPGDAIADARDALGSDTYVPADGLDATDASVADTAEASDATVTLGISDGSVADAAPPPDATPAPPPGGMDPCAATAHPNTGELLRTITSAGGTRWYYLHVPNGYSPRPTELVLNFHGFGSDPFQEALLSRMNTAADARGIIVAYPAGIANSWNAGLCCGDSAWRSHVDDVQFVSDTIDAISREFCIDPRRVYATGMSNGGFLSHRLACELSNRIAAVAPVAGVLGIVGCTSPRPVPVLHFHGTADPLVPYYGGSLLGFPSVPITYAGWLTRESCGGAMSMPFQNGDSHCETRAGCTGGSEVILCTVDGGGHTWPGGFPIPTLGATTTDMNATDMMLDFFDRHPMP